MDDMSDRSLNPTKDTLSGMDSGIDESGRSTMTGNQKEQGGLMSKMSMGAGEGNNKNNRNNNNDNQGTMNPISKMMGGTEGSGAQQHQRDLDQNPSMGDKIKGTYEQAKGKVMNDPHTTRRGEVRKQTGNDPADSTRGSGI